MPSIRPSADVSPLATIGAGSRVWANILAAEAAVVAQVFNIASGVEASLQELALALIKVRP